MLERPTAEQVRTLAPDAAAARAGEQLADPRRWSGIGRSPSAAWGLCQGSGSSPYQVAVDLAGPAYRCSCPSRKIPCKHGLGLLFILARDAVATATPPDWAAAWLDARAARGAAAAARTERPTEADPAARARRVESREKRIEAGLAELDRWLGDLVRRGLDSARSDGYRFWDAMGARLVDAQAPSLGRSVRALGSAANAGAAWPHLLLEGAARLHLAGEAYRRIEGLPEALRSDVRALVGWTTKEEDLDAEPGIEDRWLVIGRQLDDGGQVKTARTWLLGEASGRLALHLAFGVEAAPPTVLAVPGQAFRAALAFYPSATPLRAAVRPGLVPDGAVTDLPWTTTIADALAAHADRLAANPFADAWPVILGDVVPVLRDGELLVRHADGTALPVVPPSVGARLLSVSGGHPIELGATWDGAVLRAFSVAIDGRLVDLKAPPAAPSVAQGDDRDWSRLVSAALVGTERSGDAPSVPGPVGELVTSTPIRDGEHRLLASAGVVALRLRAGRVPATDRLDLPSPAPADPRPVLAGAAARLLEDVLAGHRPVLGEYLRLAQASNRRLPEEHLPELLVAADSDPALREAIVALGGARVAWLATVIPELAGSAALAAAGDDEHAWDATAGAADRGRLVRAIRGRDPAAGRALVDAHLDQLPGDERAAVVAALGVGLSLADEPLLERTIGDRRADVRRAGADLLSRLETSAFAGRLADRARPLLATKGTLRAGLEITLPTPDAELEAAGLAGRTGAGLGERAWLLVQLLGHVPPRRWTDWLRADPPTLIGRALHTDEARSVLHGWIDAAGRFGDPAWAAALLGDERIPAAVVGIDLARVLDGLAPDTIARVVAASARHIEPATLVRMCERCAAPWPAALADAVLAVAAGPARSDAPDPAWYAIVRAAAVAAPPDRASELEQLASHRGAPRPALAAAVETIRFRGQLHDAFAHLPPA